MPFPVEWYQELGVLDTPTTIRWQDASGGDEFVFTGSVDNRRSGIFVLNGATGLSLAPAQQVVTDYPSLDGGFLQGARSAVREIQLPLFIWGVNRQEYLRLENALAATLRPDIPRRLVIEDRTFPRVRRKYIECYYSGGWEGDEGEDASGLTWRRIGLELLCPDPHFREDAAESFTLSATTPQIAIPELLGGQAWPSFKFTLPFGVGNPEVTNVTTGESLRLSFTAGAVVSGEDGEELIIVEPDGSYTPDVVEVVTAPRERIVRVNGALDWSAFDFSSDWLTVRSGDEVSVAVEEDEESDPGWSAQITIRPHHRKGV